MYFDYKSALKDPWPYYFNCGDVKVKVTQKYLKLAFGEGYKCSI